MARTRFSRRRSQVTGDRRTLDVLVVGAGLAGISAAHHLTCARPGTKIAILEARGEIGGTWSFFRYPGLRSDSDMATYGYGFKPWTSPLSIAQGPYILEYLRRTVEDCDLRRHIRFGHKVTAADFDTSTGLWTVEVSLPASGRTTTLTARFLYVSAGYYDYESGFAPQFPGIDTFAGTVVHPQFWPEELVYTDKRVVVVGSGATAVTLVPSMAPLTKHVTMLQRSPSYVLSMPSADLMAYLLNRWVGQQRAQRYVRRKNIWINRAVYKASKRAPRLVRRALLAQVRAQVPRHVDVATHFAPSYDPWEQRLCVVPDGDLFKALSSGHASVVTDRIERFVPEGIELASGQHLEADIVVMATGLNLLPFGGMRLSVDENPVDVGERFAFRSMMVSGLPNFAYAIGYSNISATLKFDLVAEHFTRLLDFMDAYGHDTFEPVPDNPHMKRQPILELKSGYVQRGISAFPHAGDEGPWTVEQAYEKDLQRLRHGRVDDPELRFGGIDGRVRPRPADEERHRTLTQRLMLSGR